VKYKVAPRPTLAFGPKGTLVSANYPVHGCPNPHPFFELALTMQALERSKDLFYVALVEPDAVVPDEVDGLAVLLQDAELYDRLGLLSCELPGVAQQVLQTTLSKPASTSPRAPRLHEPRRRSGSTLARVRRRRSSTGRLRVDSLAPHALARQLRETE
jgi:hypothetical protein